MAEGGRPVLVAHWLCMQITTTVFIGEALDLRSLIARIEGLSFVERTNWWGLLGTTFVISGAAEALARFEQDLAAWRDMRLSEDAW